MPKAKSTTEKTKTETKISKTLPYLPKNLKLPSLKLFTPMLAYRPKSYTPFLAFLLIIAAFLLGVLITKVQYLEKGQSTAVVADNNVPSTGNNQPSVGAKTEVSVGHFPAQGDPNAKVKIVEFADFRCPFCEQFYKESESQIINDYVKTGKAVYYYRHFAFLGPASVLAANASECANEQNKFWDMHKYLFDNQPPESDTSMFTVDKLTQVAGTLGLDTNKFNSCLSTNKYQKNVDKDQSEGQAAGVSGTPTMFINGVSVVGAEPYDTIKKQIETALAE